MTKICAVEFLRATEFMLYRVYAVARPSVTRVDYTKQLKLGL